MRTPVESRLEVNGLPLHLLTWDGGGSTTLLLLHGYLDQSWSFVEMVRGLPPDLHVVAVDLRGHGDSGWIGPGGYYHFPDYVLDIAEIADAVRREALVLVGHSMGGHVAAQTSGTLPSSMSALVLVEGLGMPDVSFDEAPRRFEAFVQTVRDVRGKTPVPIPDLTEVARRLKVTCPRISEALLAELARHAVRPHPSGAGYLWKFDPLHRTRAPTPFYFGQFAQFLRRISCPTLLVYGAESQMRLPDDEIERRAGLIARATQVTIPEAGHMIHVEQPRALAAEIARFLGANALSSGC